nr:striatin-like [Paramormyrops kingsleyae]
MDEQAGPGVFFNANNSSVLPGGVKGAQPAEGGPGAGGGEAARAQYSIPGILHFLQHEWARFEVERAQWDAERAELQAQIAFLQGERKGQENLKKDLVRRIKMLEYALKQERAKFHKLKYGTELNQGEIKPPSYDSDDGNENENENENDTQGPQNSQLTWKQGRQLLRQCPQLRANPIPDPGPPCDPRAGVNNPLLFMKLRAARCWGQQGMNGGLYCAGLGIQPLCERGGWYSARRGLSLSQRWYRVIFQRAPCQWRPQSWESRQLSAVGYLQEVGYTDTILDVKSQRVKALLGLAGDEGERAAERSPEAMVNGSEPALKGGVGTGKPDLSDSASVLEAFKFIESAAAEFSDEDEDDDSEGRDKTIIDSSTIVRKKAPSSPSSSDISDDPDTEEALKGFDFLTSPDELDGSPESRSAGDGTDWEKEEQCPMSEAWDVDQGLITKLKEQYRKERKGKKGVKSKSSRAAPLPVSSDGLYPGFFPIFPFLPLPTRHCSVQPLYSSIRHLFPHYLSSLFHCHLLWKSHHHLQLFLFLFIPLFMFLPSFLSCHPSPPTEMSPLRSAGGMATPPAPAGPGIETVTEPHTALMGSFTAPFKLLAHLGPSCAASHWNIGNNKDALRKTWNPKFTLRSHFDAIRGLAFHPAEPVLVTASEDHTLKMWNLQKTAPAKKSTALDVEPIYTFRAHRGSVLCVVMSTSGDQCFSGGVDGTIQSWNTPNPNIDPYDSYEPNVLRGALCGHTDAVWGLVYSSAHQRLLSCSADGTVRLWDAGDTSPALAVFNENGELGIPSSVDLVCSEPAYMVTSFNSGRTGLFNMETRQLVLSLESVGEPGTPSQINKVLSHPTLPISITAQEDRHIKFFDNNTGKLIHSMVAHLDAVTSLAVDPNGLYLMSGSHDCSIRLWNLESKTCIQEFTAHRKKFEESIHDVAFHPTKCYIASAGADALAKVFV